MRVCSFHEKQKRENRLCEKGVSTPFLRSEEKGQAIAREVITTTPPGQKVVFVCSSDLDGMALLSAARIVYASGREVVVGIVSPAGEWTPAGWKNHLEIGKKRGIKTIFFLDKTKGWNDFLLASVGGQRIIATFFSHWRARIDRQSFGEWAIRSFPFVIGVELPFGYPEAIPVHQTWCLDVAVEEIMEYPWRGIAGEMKVIPTYGSDTADMGKTFLSTMEEVAGLLHIRSPEGHKGTFGRLLIVGGSENYPGAVFLAGAGALRSGCGLVTIASGTPLPYKDPQITYLPLPPQREKETLETYLQKLHTSTILVGNGWGEDRRHIELLRFLLSQPYASHIVLDADALNLLSRFPELFELLEKQKSLQRKNLVLTPHGGEAVRLLRVTPDIFRTRRKELCVEFSRRLSATLVQKNATTLIATPDGEVWYSCYGNNALAKGGSGDILAGLIGGLLASGYEGRDAALVATFLLGKTAELFTENYPAEACTPESLLSLLPEAWKRLYDIRKKEG